MTTANASEQLIFSKDDERWQIEELANELREDWPPVPNPWRPGFERRTRRDVSQVLKKLAVLQRRYEATDDTDEIKKLAQHAMLLVIPMLAAGQNRHCQYSGKPCPKLKDARLPDGEDVVRCQLRKSRQILAWQLIWQHASKRGPAGDDGYSWPIITIRERQKKEIWQFQQSKHAEDRRKHREYVIGMAVLNEYRKNNSHGNSIDAAWQTVADLKHIDGISTGGVHNVEKNYKQFRKACFERGYADERAFWAQYNSEPWPDDQVWLSDFPRISEG